MRAGRQEVPDERTAGTRLTSSHSVDTVEFLLRLRSRGIRNLDILRALEQVPRSAFVPHRYLDLALRDVALPIPCGQTMPDAFALARMIEALELKPEHRVLEIGTGSGFGTAVIAKLVGEVVSIERFQSLATAARMRLAALNVSNAEVLWGDGFQLDARSGSFDRILVEAEWRELPQRWRTALAPGGVVVIARPTALPMLSQQIVQWAIKTGGNIVETIIMASRLQSLLTGRAAAL